MVFVSIPWRIVQDAGHYASIRRRASSGELCLGRQGWLRPRRQGLVLKRDAGTHMPSLARFLKGMTMRSWLPHSRGDRSKHAAGYDLFISYAFVDRPVAKHLRRRLQWSSWTLKSRARMRVFHDSSSLAAGPIDENIVQ